MMEVAHLSGFSGLVWVKVCDDLLPFLRGWAAGLPPQCSPWGSSLQHCPTVSAHLPFCSPLRRQSKFDLTYSNIFLYEPCQKSNMILILNVTYSTFPISVGFSFFPLSLPLCFPSFFHHPVLPSPSFLSSLPSSSLPLSPSFFLSFILLSEGQQVISYYAS